MFTLSHYITYNRCTASISAAVLFFVISIFGGAPFSVQAATVTPRIELTGDAGQTLTETVKLQNEQKESKTYYITFENFESQDESGNPRFTERKEDLSSWLQSNEVVTLGPSETKDIVFKVVIPKNAEPGGHFAAIFFQTEPPDPNNPGQVAVSAKLGSLILLRVNGDFQQGATVLDFATALKQHIFTALPITFYYRFQNVGDDHLKPVGDVLIKSMLGRTSKILPANPVDGSVLPKSIRRFETVWLHSNGPVQELVVSDLPTPPKGFWNNVKYEWHNFAFGKYTATLKVVFGTKQLQSANAKYTFWVIPWHLLLVIIGSLLIIFIVGRFSLRRYNKYIIAQARRQAEAAREKRQNASQKAKTKQK